MKKTLIALAFVLSVSFIGCSSKNKNLNNKQDEHKTTNINSNKINATENSKQIKKEETHQIPINKENFKFNDEGIPVIMYHSIKYEKNNCVRLPKEKFEKQMKYLKDNNYTTLTLDELYDFIENNKPVPRKSVVLTFDDGYKDNYETAYPILKKYGFKGTVFVITNCINTGEYLTSEQLKEMDKNGFDVQSHTVNHENLTELSYEQQYNTVLKSKNTLEKLLNKKIKYIAYPYGKFNEDTINAVKNAGYNLAVTTAGTWADKSDGIYTLDRVFISGFHNMKIFKTRISNPNYHSK